MTANDTLTLKPGADTADLWLRAPAEAHRLWRQGMMITDERAYAEHSTAQYRSLFGRFCAWMAGKRLNLRQVSGDDVSRFLEGLEGRAAAKPSVRTQRMYLAEIDRVMQRLVDLQVRQHRATDVLMQQAPSSRPLKPRHIVLPNDDFMGKIRERIEAILAAPQDMDALAPRPLMQAAIVTLILSGGLTPKELQKLRLKSLRPAIAGRLDAVVLRAPGHRLLQDRDIELTGWAAACVVRWWQLRAALVQQELERKSLKSMRPESAIAFAFAAAGRAVGAEFIYKAVTNLCEEGAGEEETGPQLLRNIFIAGLIRQDLPDREVADRAGLLAVDQVQHVRRAMGLRLRRPSLVKS